MYNIIIHNAILSSNYIFNISCSFVSNNMDTVCYSFTYNSASPFPFASVILFKIISIYSHRKIKTLWRMWKIWVFWKQDIREYILEKIAIFSIYWDIAPFCIKIVPKLPNIAWFIWKLKISCFFFCDFYFCHHVIFDC